jgi:hypothetical protein
LSNATGCGFVVTEVPSARRPGFCRSRSARPTPGLAGYGRRAPNGAGMATEKPKRAANCSWVIATRVGNRFLQKIS